MAEISSVGIYKLHLAENFLFMSLIVGMVGGMATFLTSIGLQQPLILLALIPLAIVEVGVGAAIQLLSRVMGKVDPYREIHK